MKYDFVVLGATGMQGRIVSRDLLETGYSVLLCGRDKKRIERLLKKYNKTEFKYVDLKNKENACDVIKSSGADVVVNCAEGDWNLNALESCIEARAHSLDLGSEIPMTKKQLKLDSKLKRRKLTHITGCGSVPGIGNVMLKYAAKDFDKIETIEVGFDWNSNIKKFVVPFSIQSIIEEFTEPATNIENCRFTKIRPISSIRNSNDKFVGNQKSFYVRHPETYTFYHYLNGKGLKNVRFYAGFPLHSFNRIMDFIELGLGSKEEVIINGIKVRPIDVLTETLKRLKIPEGYKEKEDLWVKIIGKKNRKNKITRMQCLVPTIDGWEDAGCNIDTGMPASIIAQMIKKEIIKERGSFAPESIVPPEPFFEELKKRKMVVFENGKRIN